MTKYCPVCENPLQEAANVCPQCGFKLIEATQEFHPVALDSSDYANTQPSEQTSATLLVVRGPQVGISFKLANKELTVGRSPDCDIFLNDMTVSRSHAHIIPSGNSYQISDDNSYNGVWVNNVNVAKTLLKDGDVVQIGAFSLIYKQH